MNGITTRFIETYKMMGLNGYKIAKASKEIGSNIISRQKMSNIEIGRNEATAEVLSEFFLLFPGVDVNYIMMGVSGVSGNKNQLTGIEAAHPQNPIFEKVKYVPLDATASFVDSLYDGSYETDYYGVMKEEGEVLDDSHIVFHVSGDSMQPTIPDNCKILAKKIDEGHWENASGVVAVVYGKSFVVKRILKNGLFLDNCLILKSDNPTHGEMTVERREIRGMWKAVRIVSQKIL